MYSMTSRETRLKPHTSARRFAQLYLKATLVSAFTSLLLNQYIELVTAFQPYLVWRLRMLYLSPHSLPHSREFNFLLRMVNCCNWEQILVLYPGTEAFSLNLVKQDLFPKSLTHLIVHIAWDEKSHKWSHILDSPSHFTYHHLFPCSSLSPVGRLEERQRGTWCCWNIYFNGSWNCRYFTESMLYDKTQVFKCLFH